MANEIKKKQTVCFVFGGNSSEHEVSCVSAMNVIENADPEKYDIIPLGITKEGEFFVYSGAYENIGSGEWKRDRQNLTCANLTAGSTLCLEKDGKLEKIKIDVIFPVMHGAYGEDGRIQGLFELYGFSYVGSPCAASAVCMDKAFTKQILSNFDIPQARTVFMTRDDVSEITPETCETIASALGLPLFVKPANAGSSVGVTKVKSIDELPAALNIAAKEDGKILVEEFIEGHEIEVAVIGNGSNIRASVPGRIDPGADFYDYDTKYKTDTSRCYIPANDISRETAEEIRALALQIYSILGCRGLSRVDFFARPDGSPVFNEINTLPGFTPISMYPKLFMYSGMKYSEIIDELIFLACEK